MYEEFQTSHLSFCDGSQGFNGREFDVNAGYIVQKSHHNLHHLCDSLLELAMFL
jgi:hypothetical protein